MHDRERTLSIMIKDLASDCGILMRILHVQVSAQLAVESVTFS